MTFKYQATGFKKRDILGETGKSCFVLVFNPVFVVERRSDVGAKG
jgi:hypothetical protein